MSYNQGIRVTTYDYVIDDKSINTKAFIEQNKE